MASLKAPSLEKLPFFFYRHVMANPKERYPNNAPGAFYVDTECIACDTCVGIAGKHFKLVNQNTHAIVFSQPTTDSERAQCMDALSACPVDAIGVTEPLA